MTDHKDPKVSGRGAMAWSAPAESCQARTCGIGQHHSNVHLLARLSRQLTPLRYYAG